MKTIAIIVAGGKGKRMGRPKQFLKIAGKPMLWLTLLAFQACKEVDGIIVVVSNEDIPKVKRFKFNKILAIVAGGKERQDSVYNGLKALPNDTEIVAIHDGARPFIAPNTVTKAVEAAKRWGAVVVGVPMKDTIKVVGSRELIVGSTLKREELWSAQTPQIFRKEVLLKAYKKGYNKYSVTDDATLVERLGIPVRMVMGDYSNLKITTPEDLLVADQILKERRKV